MKRFTKQEIMYQLENEIERLDGIITDKSATNTTRQNAKKAKIGIENGLKLIAVCADSFTLESSRYTKNRNGAICPNLGHIWEEVEIHIRSGRVNASVAESCKRFDHYFNGRQIELKACLSPTSLNTPYTNDKPVILVNGSGIYFLEAKTAKRLVNNYGRFSYSADYSDYETENEKDLEATEALASVLGW